MNDIIDIEIVDEVQQVELIIEDPIYLEPVTKPPKPLSAYELAVLDGFTGTLTEWLLSLKGADGESGEFQVSGNYLQYRGVGDEQWTNILDLTTLVISGGGMYTFNDMDITSIPANTPTPVTFHNQAPSEDYIFTSLNALDLDGNSQQVNISEKTKDGFFAYCVVDVELNWEVKIK